MIKTDRSGFVVTMHSGLCEQYVKSLGLSPSGFDFLFRTRPRTLWQQTPQGGEPTKAKCNYICPNVITLAKLRPTKLNGANVITFKCNYIWHITLTKCNYICHIWITWPRQWLLLRWCSNEWFQPIRISDTYLYGAKCNGNVISVSGSQYSTPLHFHYICPITFQM